MPVEVCLTPSDVLECRNALWVVVSAVLGWNRVAETDPGETGSITVHQFQNALSNHVYQVRWRGQSAIIRIFGSASRGSAHVFQLLSAAGLAPKSLGLFANGRVEEFLAGYGPISTVASMEQHAEGIAKELAKFHDVATSTLNGAGLRLETLTARIRRWQRAVEALESVGGEIVSLREALRTTVDVDAILDSMHGFEETVLHGDLQGLNIMVQADNVRFIDFEFLCRGPAAFDLSNHFAEWTWSGDYSVLEFRADRWPVLTKRRRFVEWYVAARGHPPGVTSEDAVRRMLAQIDVCVRVSHLHWALWGLLEGARRQGSATWDYVGYAKGRYAALVST